MVLPATHSIQVLYPFRLREIPLALLHIGNVSDHPSLKKTPFVSAATKGFSLKPRDIKYFYLLSMSTVLGVVLALVVP